jgi:hypothetical protein
MSAIDTHLPESSPSAFHPLRTFAPVKALKQELSAYAKSTPNPLSQSLLHSFQYGLTHQDA